jgi:hypothetical protein
MNDTDHDQSRLAATSRDNDFTLSLEDVAQRYVAAGHPRTIRTLQRYCASGHLDCQKVATMLGDKYLVTSHSVARHLAQIEELTAFDAVATDRGASRQVATPFDAEEARPGLVVARAADSDQARQAKAGETVTSHDLTRLEREVEQLNGDREFRREQIKVKDGQIASLLERDRETNVLIRGLQEMLTPLLGPARREPPLDSTHSPR